MKRKRRELSSLSLSFLDAVTCGFGAIILLLVIAKIFEPIRLEESDNELDGLIVQYQQELEDILGETDRIRREQLTTRQRIEVDEQQINALERELTRIRAAYQNTQSEAEISAEIAGQLANAKQELTDEMERLLGNSIRPRDYKVGGIPVDSEYIIFIIDTSGSMRRYAWDRVQQQIQETLEIYPTVRGIQIMNDNGEHMFLSTRGEWMRDTPQLRREILEELDDWEAFSNSSPREGILRAIDLYYDPAKKISLYVYSDDFSQGSIDAVVREVDYRNRYDENGRLLSAEERRVRIHAVAFPVFWEALGQMATGGNYAILMRILCQRNGGTFVALPSSRG
ncbi:MAG: VWA domain-containing protein [Gammaproteobacteria bacterium]|nr:VWA domain-containing protein [Gammaproteobacteria bacterium]